MLPPGCCQPHLRFCKKTDVKSSFETHNENPGYDVSKQHPSKFGSGFQVLCANPALAYVFYKYLTTDALVTKTHGAGGTNYDLRKSSIVNYKTDASF